MIISICGKSGCGKSTFAKQIMELSKNDVVHLDIDNVSHNILLLDEVKEELIKVFGDSIIENNSINRKKLSKIVFASKVEMDKLTEITWKYMQMEIDKFLSQNKDKIILLDWILLPNTKYFHMSRIKILLDIPYNIRKQRAMKRDNITEDDFDLRDSSSIEYNKEEFDYVIEENNNEIVRKLVSHCDKSTISREF